MNATTGILALLGATLVGGGLGFAYDGLTGLLTGLTGTGLLAVFGILAGGSVQDRQGGGGVLAAGLFVLFLGERLIGVGTFRWVVSGVALLMIAGGLGLRLRAMSSHEGRTKEAHRLALMATVGILVGLVMYALSLDAVARSVFADEAGQTRWINVMHALFPIAVSIGLLPMLSIERVLSLHPVVVPPGSAKEAGTLGLSAALALCLVFPVNYLATQYEWTNDTAYFKTTDVGESTRAVAQSMPEPVTVTVFYPAGSDVGTQAIPYFRTLGEASAGMINVKVIDQALAPALSAELSIRENGWVSFQMGASKEKMKIGTVLRKAKRNLKKLDSLVQKNLLKVSRGQRKAYFVVGHGEANFRERENQLRKLNLMKRSTLEDRNFKIGNLGLFEGLAAGVPDDADLVILAAPEKPLQDAEIESLNSWLKDGGAMMIMVEPDGDPLTGILEPLGLKVDGHKIADAEHFAPQNRGAADRVLLTTNRYGSHAASRFLSQNGTTMPMLLPEVQAIKSIGDKKVGSTLIRTHPEAWEDVVPDYRKGKDERGQVYDLAVAVEGKSANGNETWRAVVVGDVNWASDPALRKVKGNLAFVMDTTRWLVGDESILGSVENEEDVLIEHTRNGDALWFYLTVFAMPLLVVGLGTASVQMRSR